MANAISNPLPLFADPRGGLLDGGYIYIGVENLEPETNPIPVFWDTAGTQPAAQPLRTIGGMASRNGAPAHVHVNAPYSLTVKDSRGILVLHLPAASAAASAADDAIAAAGNASASAAAAATSATTASTAAVTATSQATAAGASATGAAASASAASASAAAASASASSAAASAAAAAAGGSYGPLLDTSSAGTLRVEGNIVPDANGTRGLGTNALRWGSIRVNAIIVGLNQITGGSGSPEGVVVGSPGDLFLRDNGGAGTSFYVKESGFGNTGWVAK